METDGGRNTFLQETQIYKRWKKQERPLSTKDNRADIHQVREEAMDLLEGYINKLFIQKKITTN